MASNNSNRSTSNGELVNHFNAVRLRMLGSGNLDLQWNSMDEVIQQNLLPLTLSAATNIQPTRLSNFKQQRASLKISTNVINEWFKITRLVVWVKPIASGYPG